MGNFYVIENGKNDMSIYRHLNGERTFGQDSVLHIDT